jgi:arylsulfatase A-like enzyme
MTRPNILYVHSHDTGRYVEPYGHAVPTPNLRHLARQGALFRQAFCANPTCSPSRAALLTGQYPHQTRMFGLAHLGWTMTDYRRHVVHALRAAGYRSALSGVQHIIPRQRTAEIGYDERLVPQGSGLEPDAAAAAWLRAGPPEPFFLSVGFGETHRRYPTAHPEHRAGQCLPPPHLPDTPETREDMARYKASARVLDHRVGVVLEALERAGLAHNTLVICTTDHGIAFPRMKCSLFDGGIGVMLILRGPGGFSGGKTFDAPVSHVDLYPTVCELAGAQQPAWLEGHSLCPLGRGETDAVRDAVFAELNYHVAYQPERCVRTRRYKYIRRYGDRTRPILPNCDDSPSKDVMMRAGWYPFEREALYDTFRDPQEAHNLVGDGDAADVLKELRDRLDAWQRRTDDPILSGPIPPREGAVFSHPDAVSPSEPKKPFAEHPQY